MNSFNNYSYRGALTTFQQHDLGNFFFIVTNFDVDRKEIKAPICNNRPYFLSESILSEVTTFDSEPTTALSILSNNAIEDDDFLDIHIKPIPSNKFTVKAKIKSVQLTIPKILPVEDYLL